MTFLLVEEDCIFGGTELVLFGTKKWEIMRLTPQENVNLQTFGSTMSAILADLFCAFIDAFNTLNGNYFDCSPNTSYFFDRFPLEVIRFGMNRLNCAFMIDQ